MLSNIFRKISKLVRSQKGATLIEYVLIASLLSIALVAGYKSVGNSYRRIYNNIANAI